MSISPTGSELDSYCGRIRDAADSKRQRWAEEVRLREICCMHTLSGLADKEARALTVECGPALVSRLMSR